MGQANKAVNLKDRIMPRFHLRLDELDRIANGWKTIHLLKNFSVNVRAAASWHLFYPKAQDGMN